MRRACVCADAGLSLVVLCRRSAAESCGRSIVYRLKAFWKVVVNGDLIRGCFSSALYSSENSNVFVVS